MALQDEQGKSARAVPSFAAVAKSRFTFFKRIFKLGAAVNSLIASFCGRGSYEKYEEDLHSTFPGLYSELTFFERSTPRRVNRYYHHHHVAVLPGHVPVPAPPSPVLPISPISARAPSSPVLFAIRASSILPPYTVGGLHDGGEGTEGDQVREKYPDFSSHREERSQREERRTVRRSKAARWIQGRKKGFNLKKPQALRIGRDRQIKVFRQCTDHKLELGYEDDEDYGYEEWDQLSPHWGGCPCICCRNWDDYHRDDYDSPPDTPPAYRYDTDYYTDP